ncbi:MAG: decaprenylphospho-beta-D-erythro-pentofuranosid-2-ulose 2-reductase [Mycobacteriales bacterium]
MRNAVGDVQTVLVLGGGSDIGLAVAGRLVRQGARTVVLAGRRPEAYAGAEQTLRAAGATRVHRVAFDADDTDSHSRVVKEVVATVGDLDVTVVAFGVLGDQSVDEYDPAAAVAVARTNYLGGVSALTVLGQQLRTQGHGALVVLSSVAGERVRRSNFVYGSTKAGLDGFATGLADALHGSGARVLVVRPGFVVSKMTAGMEKAPLSTTPEAVAEVVAKGLAGSATVVWAPAPLRLVMSVLRHVPRPLFRRLPV